MSNFNTFTEEMLPPTFGNSQVIGVPLGEGEW
jgi:hypothetical protein